MGMKTSAQLVAARPEPAADQTSLYGTLLEQSDDLILAVDAQLRLCLANPAVERKVGRDAAAMLGRTVVELALFGEDAAALQASLMQAMDSSQAQCIELQWLCDGGHTCTYQAHVMVEADADGRVRRLLVQARDITEHAASTTTCGRREREFRTLAENSPDDIIRYGHGPAGHLLQP